MDIDEAKILVIDDIIKVITDVNYAVNNEITKTVSKYSRKRVICGSNIMCASVVNTLNIIQKQLLEQLANRSMMA